MFLEIALCFCGQITADDYFSLSYVSSCSVSPSGEYVAWTEGRWDEELDRRNYDIWIVSPLEPDSTTRLTFDESNDGSLQWGNAEEWLYFSSHRGNKGDDLPRNGKKQIWRIKPDGTQLMAVTRLASGIEDWKISKDGSHVYYVMSEETNLDDGWKTLRTEYNDVEYGHGLIDYSEIWVLNLETWKHEKIWEEEKVVVAFAPSPDGKQIATITTPDTRLITNEGCSDIGIYDIATKETTLLDDTLWRASAPSPYGWVEAPQWSSDGSRLVFAVDFDGFPRNMFVATFGDSKIVLQQVDRKDEVSLGSDPSWIPNSYNLLYIAEQGTMRPLLSVSNVGNGHQGKTTEVVSNNLICWDFSIAESTKQIAGIVGNAVSLPSIVVTTENSNIVSVIANPNVHTKEWKLSKVQTVQWTAKDGTTVEGVLELPQNFVIGIDDPLPMYVDLHGGPTSARTSGLEISIYGRGLLSSDGWAVFSPNYRGSTGYGDKFLTDLVGHENEIEVQDILDGVDALIERGIADPDKLAVGGWSNGGYLTNCLISTTNRFKAASSGAGVFDQAMQWSIEDTPGHVVNYARGLPWEVPSELRRMSPLYEADNITTPTIIHVGEGDARVPAEQSKALFRALYDYLDIPTQLVIYPNAGHGLSKMSHRRAKIEWDRAWLNRWVLGIH